MASYCKLFYKMAARGAEKRNPVPCHAHSLLPKLYNSEISKREISNRATNFVRDLCNCWLNISYGFYRGSSGVENTLIVTDANSPGWSGCIFGLIKTKTEDWDYLPMSFSLDGLLSAHQDELVPPSKSITNFLVSVVLMVSHGIQL